MGQLGHQQQLQQQRLRVPAGWDDGGGGSSGGEAASGGQKPSPTAEDRVAQIAADQPRQAVNFVTETGHNLQYSVAKCRKNFSASTSLQIRRGEVLYLLIVAFSFADLYCT
jgi:hypothetical protein